MSSNGLHQIRGAAIVQEEEPLAESPQRRCAKFISTCGTLADLIRELRTHLVDSEIRVGMDRLVAEPRAKRTRAGHQCYRMAVRATDVEELVGALDDGVVAWSARRRRKEAHEDRELGCVV